MSDIDVNDVILNSEISGTRFVVIRRPETVDNTGFSNVNEERFGAIGSIAPVDMELMREEGYDSEASGIDVITPFRLRTASRGFKPDIILWNGNYYIVHKLEDWSIYGAGFIKARCMSENFVDEAPK